MIKNLIQNLKYIEKVADVPADALSSKTRSGGSTMGLSTTEYSLSDLFALVKQYRYSIPEATEDMEKRKERGQIGEKQAEIAKAGLWQHAGEEYGTIPEGENAAADFKVPKQVEEGKKVRRFVRTILETGSLDNEMLETMTTDIILGDFSIFLSSEICITTALLFIII